MQEIRTFHTTTTQYITKAPTNRTTQLKKWKLNSSWIKGKLLKLSGFVKYFGIKKVSWIFFWSYRKRCDPECWKPVVWLAVSRPAWNVRTRKRTVTEVQIPWIFPIPVRDWCKWFLCLIDGVAITDIQSLYEIIRERLKMDWHNETKNWHSV